MANFDAAVAALRTAYDELRTSETPLSALASVPDTLIASINVLTAFQPPAGDHDAARAAAFDAARRQGYTIQTYNDSDSGKMWRVVGLDGATFQFKAW